MRDLIQIVEGFVQLNEFKIESVEGVKVWINPTAKIIENLINDHNCTDYKGIVDRKNNLYIWDGQTFIHANMAMRLGIDYDHILYKLEFNMYGLEFYTLAAGWTDIPIEIINSTPSLKRAFASIKFEENDDIEEQLNEFRIETVRTPTTDVKVWINPTYKELQTILSNRQPQHKESARMSWGEGSNREYRGLVDKQGNLYIWEAFRTTHSTMRDQLGLDETPFSLYLDKDGGVECWPDWTYNPHPITQEEINSFPSLKLALTPRKVVKEFKIEKIPVRHGVDITIKNCKPF